MALPNIYKATGIILKRKNSGEGDKIITALCLHHGKKRFIGKGIRKITSRRSGHVELFSKTEFVIHRGKALDYITGATVQHVHGASYHILPQLAASYTACEVVDKLIMEGQEHDEAYYLLDRLLTDAETLPAKDLPGRLAIFIDILLIDLGYKRPQTHHSSLGNALSGVEHIIERKVRSTNLLLQSGMELYPRKI